MDIKITSIEITKSSVAIGGGGRSKSAANVEVTLASDAGTFVLRYPGQQFSSLDELVQRVQEHLKSFAHDMTERLDLPLL